MATIDTLALAERLEREYGDDPERARRHARIPGDMAAASDVATRQDIKDLSTEIGQLRTEMGHKRDALRGEMQHEIGSVRGEIGQLRTEMHEMEARLRIETQSEGNKLRAELHKEISNLAWKVAGLLVAQAAVIIALLRLLPGGAP
jgi:phage host-nuclease inhibitor protein Gam